MMVLINEKDAVNYLEILEKDVMKGIWMKDKFDQEQTDLVKGTTKKVQETIRAGVEQAIQRMLEMGYRMDEIEISTTNSGEGLTIQIRSKIKHRRMTEFELMLRRMFNEDAVKRILKWLSKSDDIDQATLKRECSLHDIDIQDLHATMYSHKYLIVTQDLFHDCHPQPVTTVEVQETHPKPVIKHCPKCEEKIELGTSFWGGYHYRLSPALFASIKGEYERLNRLEDK